MRVWTIGHGARDFDTVVADLTRHGCQTIVDVRSTPYSRHAPEFSKANLEVAAASAGFGYRWLGDRLGGKPPPSPAQLESGIDELAGLCATSRVVLICSELDPMHCHRDSVLAPAMVGRGYEVVHILYDGDVVPYQDHLDLEE